MADKNPSVAKSTISSTAPDSPPSSHSSKDSSEPKANAAASGAQANGAKRKKARRASPFLIALRRVELLIETLPEEVALKVAQHAVFIAEQRIRKSFDVGRTLAVPNREVGVTGEANG